MVGEQLRPTGVQHVVGDGAVLVAHPIGICRVLVLRSGEDRQIGIAQSCGVDVIADRPMVSGDANKSGGLGGRGSVFETTQCQCRRTFLVVGASDLVDGVMEPRGNFDRFPIEFHTVVHKNIHGLQDCRKMINGVISTVRLAPSRQQVRGEVRREIPANRVIHRTHLWAAAVVPSPANHPASA
ncbi:hypothetical protein ASG12_07735 [Williamsia sp. Leaf354]|nr:hypothetical protein ASG12_07735 [Williamsia sp. Leaf354]